MNTHNSPIIFSLSKFLWFAGGILFISALIPFAIQQHGRDNPVPIQAYMDGNLPDKTPNSATDWQTVVAFPNLTFDNVTVFEAEAGTNRLYVGQRNGLIHYITNDSLTNTKTPFLDIRNRVAETEESGLLGMTFHPRFGLDSNYVYVYYGARVPNANVQFVLYEAGYPGNFYNTWGRLSRFTVDPVTHLADPNSELIMINKRLYNSSHKGGALLFDNDGFLYLSLGDEGRFTTSQAIDTLLEGGVLRLDVDKNPLKSHAPIRTLPFNVLDEYSGIGYWIPNDNPFLDPAGGQFEEYYAVGLRQPYRMTYDAVLDHIWIGEVGESQREEVNVLAKGANYGWPFREGTLSGGSSQPASLIGTLTEPIVDFTRNQMGCLIGGYVYRGTLNPSLVGKYICGDWNTDKLWAVNYDPATGTGTKSAIGSFNPGYISSFGQDQNGEVFVLSLNTNYQAYKFTPITPTAEAPALLSQTGVFTDMANLTPAAGLIPYELNEPFWSDGAAKFRWLAVPNDGTHNTNAERIFYSAKGEWVFPVGSVFVKHFELPIDENNPSITRRLETRLMVRGSDGDYYGLTYRWRANGLEADLLTTAHTDTFSIATANSPREVTWDYPDRSECLICHNTASGKVLGPKSRQLNKDIVYPSTGRTANQLTTFTHLGMFDIPADTSVAGLGSLLTSVPSSNPVLPITDRARSYLDINCANCHRPGTGNRANFDARLNVPLEVQGLLYGELNENLGIAGARVMIPGDTSSSALYERLKKVHDGIAMPPLAKNRIDTSGVKLIAEWINSLNPQAPVAGKGLQGTYFSDATLTTPVLVRTDITVDFDWVTGSPDNIVPIDNFSARWEGEVMPLYSETYIFHVNAGADGLRLWVNNQLIIDQWANATAAAYSGTIALTSGQKVPIKLEYKENTGDAEIHLGWSSDTQLEEYIPQNFLFPPNAPTLTQAITFGNLADMKVGDAPFTVTGTSSSGLPLTFSVADGPATILGSTVTLLPNQTGEVIIRAEQIGNATYEAAPIVERSFDVVPVIAGNGTGLLGTYYDNADFTNEIFSRVDPQIDFYWGSGSPNPAVAYNTYSVVWEGEVEAPLTETFTFITTTDDGVRLWVDNQLIVDKWQDQAVTENSGSINMIAWQRVPIRMEFYENGVYASAQLKWSSASITPQVVPVNALYPALNNVLPVEWLSFEADQQDAQVDIRWETKSEINSDHFEVERSGDLQSFEAIGQIEAAGNSVQNRSYRLPDLAPNSGINYYRLKAVDLDGTFSYSQVESVYFENTHINIYPNPPGPDQMITLDILQTEAVTMEVFDQNGRLLKRQEVPGSTERQQVEVSMEGFSAGIYFITVRNRDIVYHEKILINP